MKDILRFRSIKLLILFIAIPGSAYPVKAQTRFFLEVMPGTAYIIPSNLKVTQEGYEDIMLTARYKVHAFTSPIYYSVRAGYYLKKNLSVGLEFNHLKLYLENKPPEITGFSISHGYNQFWLNISKHMRFFDYRFGIGPVIAHPESTVRGLRLDESQGLFGLGYHIHGITSQASLYKKISLFKFLYLIAEAKMNISYTRTIIANGHANVSVYAIHGLLGLGIEL